MGAFSQCLVSSSRKAKANSHNAFNILLYTAAKCVLSIWVAYSSCIEQGGASMYAFSLSDVSSSCVAKKHSRVGVNLLLHTAAVYKSYR